MCKFEALVNVFMLVSPHTYNAECKTTSHVVGRKWAYDGCEWDCGRLGEL